MQQNDFSTGQNCNRLQEVQSNNTDEEYLTLTQAAKRLPRSNGKRVHSSTLWRWCRRGFNGIRLKYYRVGRTIMVTDSTLKQFFTALAQADLEQAQQSQGYRAKRRRPIRPEHRQKSIDEANEILRRARILI